jgi:hypothetical protein
MCGDQGQYAPDLRLLVRSFSSHPPFSFPFAERDLIYPGGKRLFGDSARLLDIWPSLSTSPVLTHFSWSPLMTAALSANAHFVHPAHSSSTPSLLHPLPTHLFFQAYSRCTFGEGTTSSTEHLTNWRARFMGSMSFPGCQTCSRRPHSAQIVVTIITGTAIIYHPNGEHLNARTAFQRLNKSFRVCARYAHRSCGRQS